MAKKVLIVEDDEDIRVNLTELLVDQGYRVEAASNGRFALQLLRSQTELPGVIILDIMMPVMNGFEFREVQELDPQLSEIPVVVMTADTHAESKKLKVGAKALIRKPLNILEVLDIVERFV